MIDLHTHTTVSDGTDSPAELVAAAAAAGVTTLALTDHDTTGGWASAAEAALRHGVDLVRGVEVSCSHHGVSVHLLGYLVDPTHEELAAELSLAREGRHGRLQRMVDLLAADGVPITIEDVRAQLGVDATPGRPHIADALVANGVVRDRDEAFATFLAGGSPYYVPHYAPDPVRAVELVVAAGGVAVMAHPFAGRRGRTVDDDVIAAMAAAGMTGLEVDHRDHDPAERAHGLGLARELGLVVTGSSDYHGTGKLNRLAENTTVPEALEALEAAATSDTRVVRA
ncbi:PHP domain-containing protein [Janibacter sp. G56]